MLPVWKYEAAETLMTLYKAVEDQTFNSELLDDLKNRFRQVLNEYNLLNDELCNALDFPFNLDYNVGLESLNLIFGSAVNSHEAHPE